MCCGAKMKLSLETVVMEQEDEGPGQVIVIEVWQDIIWMWLIGIHNCINITLCNLLNPGSTCSANTRAVDYTVIALK